ncbi:hypothetical protein DM02DRAFT_191879 [Periconia macrospinosa]|uniref:Uncharacterized protein n=1 Tax=Periconia macrospinosa TaxID=97972 RepID=A0A2V1D8M2_9PLEO|nr:hypothetical protein DM02DRAFT_191879 [Periconia macrospinosa]
MLWQLRFPDPITPPASLATSRYFRPHPLPPITSATHPAEPKQPIPRPSNWDPPSLRLPVVFVAFDFHHRTEPAPATPLLAR